MKTIPERATKIKELIREALTKKYNCSPVERADKLYADVEYQFRKIHEQQVKNLNIPAVSNSLIAYQKWCYQHPEYDQVCETSKVELYIKGNL